jgi:hypothetical protein
VAGDDDGKHGDIGEPIEVVASRSISDALERSR